jgi:tetratricopeptide (TPR) repeat protein
MRRHSRPRSGPARIDDAHALLDDARELLELGHEHKAVKELSELIGAYGSSPDLELAMTVTSALVSRAEIQASLGHWEPSLSDTDEALRRIGRYKLGRSTPEQLAAVPAQQEARARWRRATALEALGRTDEEEREVAELVGRFEDSRDDAVYPYLASALGRQATTAVDREENGRALGICREIVTRFTSCADLDTQAQVAFALTEEAFLLEQAGDDEGSLAAYDRLIERFEPADDPDIQRYVAAALYNRARWHEDRSQLARARSEFETIADRYRGAGDPELRYVAAQAEERRRVLAARFNL